MYALYHNKEVGSLIISAGTNLNINESKLNDTEVVVFNSCYYASKDRKALKTKAEELKADWLKETEERVEMLKNLKIKNKY